MRVAQLFQGRCGQVGHGSGSRGTHQRGQLISIGDTPRRFAHDPGGLRQGVALWTIAWSGDGAALRCWGLRVFCCFRRARRASRRPARCGRTSAAWLASDEQARQRRQPIAPTFVSEETRIEAVRYLLSISRMGTRPYPLDAIYARLDPSVRTGVTRLRAVGADGDVEFRELTTAFAGAIGACVVPIARFAEDLHFDGVAVVVVAPVKGERRIVEKALTHALGDVSLVQDLVRGSVAVDHPDDVRAVAERTLDVLRSRERRDHRGRGSLRQ